MDNRPLSEKESLQLIAQMIQQTQRGLARNAGTPFLIWGYMTAGLALIIWWLLEETADPQWNLLWFLLPVVCVPLTIWHSRRSEMHVRTYIDRVISQVWTVFGTAGFFVSLIVGFFWHLPVLFFILLIMGMGTALTGLIARLRILLFCGTTGALLSFGSLLIPGIEQYLLFAAAFLIMMVIPGHVLNHMATKMSAL